MYTFSSKLKTLSIVLMILGILGIGYGFLNAPKNTADVEKILKEESEAHHGGGHHEAAHEASHEMPKVLPAEEHQSEASHHEQETHENAVHETIAEPENSLSVKPSDSITIDSAKIASSEIENYTVTPPAEERHLTAAEEKAEHEDHVNHVFHQLQNKPWAALYVACIFIMLISLGALVFYAIQQVSQAGWSPVLFRVMQGISAYLPVGSVIFFVLLVLCGLHFNHLFVWLEDGIAQKGHENYDKLVAAKSGYLNFPSWIIRAAVFLIGWNLYRYFSRKNCLAQEAASDNAFYKKNFNISAMFLVFFIVTESIMSWDWIMSVDPHWFSTLFGWYVFASFIVSSITVIALVTLYLKNKGYLEHVNTSHIHDLAKFMFGFSVFWTYLWFSQFMLIWYADIPEEVTYFVTRINDYGLPFWGAVVMNFVFPILILMNSDFKRLTWIIVMAGIIILFGHYVDFFNMIMPGTVGDRWFIGIPEIGSLCFFIGLFLLVVFNALTKAPLLPKRNPYIEESKHFHY
jgi:Ni/Fe-hydrogenase subunit HybB-like protein